MIIKPTGKITSIDVDTITAAYGSVVSGTQKLRSMEILRASCVKIDNQSDTPICARVVHVQGLEVSTGLTYNHSYTIDQEVGNYMDVIVKPARLYTSEKILVRLNLMILTFQLTRQRRMVRLLSLDLLLTLLLALDSFMLLP